MKYLVTGTNGPGFFSAEEALEVLDGEILPTFEALIKLEAEKKIVGGLPIGERAFVFILEASSHDEADQLIRSLPSWGAFDWEVVPLQSLQLRANYEHKVSAELKTI